MCQIVIENTKKDSQMDSNPVIDKMKRGEATVGT